MLNLFDDGKAAPEDELGALDFVEEPTSKAISPFVYVKAINQTKEALIVDEETERQYNPYMVNRALSFGSDTILYANEMNRYPLLPKKAQFDFLSGAIRARKRFDKYLKPDGNDKLKVLKTAFRCNTRRAMKILPLLTEEQFEEIRLSLETGGQRGKGKTK